MLQNNRADENKRGAHRQYISLKERSLRASLVGSEGTLAQNAMETASGARHGKFFCEALCVGGMATATD